LRGGENELGEGEGRRREVRSSELVQNVELCLAAASAVTMRF